MRLSTDSVPATFDQAVAAIFDALEPAEIAALKSLPDADTATASMHNSIGRHLRNAWSLWEVETPLRVDMRARFTLEHPDDLTGLILADVAHRVFELPFDRAEVVRRACEHWRAMGRNLDGTAENPALDVLVTLTTAFEWCCAECDEQNFVSACVGAPTEVEHIEYFEATGAELPAGARTAKTPGRVACATCGCVFDVDGGAA